MKFFQKASLWAQVETGPEAGVAEGGAACKPAKKRKKAAPASFQGEHAELLDDCLLGSRPNPMPVRNQ